MRICLLNMDDGLLAQTPFLEYCADIQAIQLDLRDLGRRMRLWSSRRAMREFSRQLHNWGFWEGDEPVLTFLGSGDFHHLSAALIGQHSEPLTLIHFDNHPDFIRLSARYHCASWVNRVLEMQRVRRVVTVGPCTDLSVPQLEWGNLPALTSGKLELYPFRHAPSRVLGQFGSGPSHRQEGLRIRWQNLHDEDWETFWNQLLERIPTSNVYVSIDKDVLVPADAETNWDQGEMTLVQLLTALDLIALKTRIIGVDVVGDYAPMGKDRPLRRAMAWLDHPRHNVVQQDVAQVNARTNIAISEQLLHSRNANLRETVA